MMWRISLVLLICLAAGPAYSNPPSPTPPKSSHKPETNPGRTNENPTTDHRGTETDPLFIKVLPPITIEPESSNEQEKARDYTSAEWWLVYVTSTLTAVTLVLAWFTGWLWLATRRLVIGAEKTSERQLRAYVAVDTISIQHVFTGGRPYAEARIKNYGQTPAYKLSCIGGIAIGESFDKLGPPTGSPVAPQHGLAPTAMFIHKDTAPRMLMADEVLAIKAGTATLWVYGNIKYKDTFGRDRFTDYRYMIGGNVGIHETMCTCEQGNEED